MKYRKEFKIKISKLMDKKFMQNNVQIGSTASFLIVY